VFCRLSHLFPEYEIICPKEYVVADDQSASAFVAVVEIN